MLSIDITDRQIKLVRGVHSGSKIKVQDADMRELSMGMVSNGYITDVPMVAAELNDIIKQKDIKEKEAVVSITSSAIVYKELLVAKPKNMKNPAIIEAMIQSNMNISSDYNISFTIAGETEDEEKNKMLKVIASACPQRLVDGYVRLFSHIGLQLKGVYISNNSVTRLIVNTPKLADKMPMLLIQIDKNFLNMNLYEDNQIVFSRFFNIDPNDYDNAPDYVTRAVQNDAVYQEPQGREAASRDYVLRRNRELYRDYERDFFVQRSLEYAFNAHDCFYVGAVRFCEIRKRNRRALPQK